MGELVYNGAILPPFLMKCYDLVDDPATDPVISWSTSNDSFVIWNVPEFSQVLLPKYFKHSNFSSFVRQLNTYGFRKSGSDRCEFTNDGFIKGQKHLLKNIRRRKQTQDPVQQKQSEEMNTSVGACLDVKMFGLWEEVEMLNKDKNTIMQEFVNLKQHQESAKSKIVRLSQRLQGMEKNQQQMLSFLVMAMQSPGFLVQLLQPKENHWRMDETRKKRRLTMLEDGVEDDEPVDTDSQMVKYQGPMNETPRPILLPMSNTDEPLEFNTSENGLNDILMNFELKSLPMEETLLSLEDDCPLIMSDIPDDDVLEQLLMAGPFLEDIVNSSVDIRNTEVTGMEMESADHAIQSENSQNLDVITEQMGLLASDHEKL